MRLKYFIILLCSLTILGLVYTWQQIEIIKLAYQGSYARKTHKEALDKNHYLRYNLLNLKSSSYLGGKLFDENTSYEIPKQFQVLSLALPKPVTQGNRDSLGRIAQPAISPSGQGFLLSSFNMQDIWPISLVTAYLDKHAQAQDIGNQ